MTDWTIDQSGISAYTVHIDGTHESRLLSAIPPEDTILPCPPLNASQLQENLKLSAKSALDKSDITMLRCVEAEITVPQEWNNYRKSLRAIANGSDTISTVLPTQPAYPAGT